MAHDTAQTADAYFCADIVKVEKNADGTCTVYGICSDDSLDLDGQRADPTWLKGALSEWFTNWANIREMHQPSAVGAASKLEWHGDVPFLTSVVVDPLAVAKCTSDPPVYKAYSIGVKNPQLRYDARAPKGWIVGGTIVETSLVDRPSNSNTRFELVKAVSADEIVDVQTGTVWKRVDPSGSAASPGDQTKEDKVGDTTEEKTVEADAGKSVDAPIEKDAAAEEKTVEAETAKDAGDGDETEMSAKSALEKAASESAYCADCKQVAKLCDPEEHKVGNGHTVLIGKCAEGHKLTKYVGADETKAADADEANDASADAAKDADADAVKAAADAEAALEKIDDIADKALGEDDDDAKAAKSAALAGGDLIKEALVDLLKSSGIDLAAIGETLQVKRIERLNAALDELRDLAEKAASVGGPAQVSNDTGLQTQMVSALRVVQELCGQLAAGDGRFGLDDGHQADSAELGKADQIAPTEQWNFNKSASADTVKAAEQQVDSSAVVAELAKSIGAHMEQVVSPLVRRLEEVEHQTKPASPPVLQIAEREGVFSEKAANAHDIGMQQFSDRLGSMSQQEREQLLARLVTSDRGWNQ